MNLHLHVFLDLIRLWSKLICCDKAKRHQAQYTAKKMIALLWDGLTEGQKADIHVRLAMAAHLVHVRDPRLGDAPLWLLLS